MLFSVVFTLINIDTCHHSGWLIFFVVLCPSISLVILIRFSIFRTFVFEMKCILKFYLHCIIMLHYTYSTLLSLRCVVHEAALVVYIYHFKNVMLHSSLTAYNIICVQYALLTIHALLTILDIAYLLYVTLLFLLCQVHDSSETLNALNIWFVLDRKLTAKHRCSYHVRPRTLKMCNYIALQLKLRAR